MTFVSNIPSTSSGMMEQKKRAGVQRITIGSNSGRKAFGVGHWSRAVIASVTPCLSEERGAAKTQRAQFPGAVGWVSVIDKRSTLSSDLRILAQTWTSGHFENASPAPKGQPSRQPLPHPAWVPAIASEQARRSERLIDTDLRPGGVAP